MAIDLEALKRPTYMTFYQALMSADPWWRRITAPILMPADASELKEAEDFGISLWEPHSAAPTSQSVDSEEHTTVRLAFDFFLEISESDLELNPGWLASKSVAAANAANLTLSLAMADAIQNAQTTAHPFTGTDVFDGASINCIDSFTLKPPQGAETVGGATISQTNEYGLAFGDRSVGELIAERAGYFDFSGNPVENDPGVDPTRPWMIVPPQNQDEAKRIAQQLGPLYDGSGIQEGKGGQVEGVIVPPAGMTTSDWFLWYRRQQASAVPGQMPVLTGPIAPVTWGPPRIEIRRQSRRNYISILGLGHWAIRYSHHIHTDLQGSFV